MMRTNHQKASITVLVPLFCMLVAIGPLNGNYSQSADAQKGYHGHYGKSYHNTGGFSNIEIIHCISAATANGGSSHGGIGGNSNGGTGGSSNGGTGGTGGSGGNGGNGGPGGITNGGNGGTSSGGVSHGGSSNASSVTTCSSN